MVFEQVDISAGSSDACTHHNCSSERKKNLEIKATILARLWKEKITSYFFFNGTPESYHDQGLTVP
jgi:hypothetical protein